jgi:hypothetical protein
MPFRNASTSPVADPAPPVNVTVSPTMGAGPEVTASETASPALAVGARVNGGSFVATWPRIAPKVIV